MPERIIRIELFSKESVALNWALLSVEGGELRLPSSRTFDSF